MSRTAAWWATCLGAGIATLIVAIGFGFIPDIGGCGPVGDAGAIIAFEIVRTPADVAALFGAEPCRTPFVEAMRLSLWIDALVFIPAYTLFLCAGLMALRQHGPKLALGGVICALLAAVFDELEGVQLFTILANLPGEQATIDWLIPYVRGKFALLALVALFLGWLMARRGGWMRWTGLLVTIGGAVTMFGLSDDSRAGLLGLGGALAWIPLLIAAAIIVWRGRRAALDSGATGP